MLREFYKEQHFKTKPELDEQELEMLNEKLWNAMEWDSEVNVIYFKNHDTHELHGKISKVDPLEGKINMLNQDEKYSLYIEDIIDIHVL